MVEQRSLRTSTYHPMKKLIMLLTAYSLSLTPVFSQGTWSPRASLPDTSRAYGIGFAIGNYGYMGLGTFNGDIYSKCYNDFWQFDPSTNSWTQKANFPGKARISPAIFVIGNYGYVVTGQESDSSPPKYTTECWQYNSVTNIWIQKANFPGSARAYDAGFAIGGKGFVGTGSSYYTNYCRDFWEYDTATNAWTQIADFGGDARLACSGFAVGGSGFVCFGWDSLQKWHKDMWEYDTATNIWIQKSNYPGYPTYAASGFVIRTNIYLGCTQDSTHLFDNKFWKYNTISDIWAEEASLPGLSRTSCSAFAVGDTGYLGLGEDSASVSFNSIYKFFPDSTTGILQLINNSTDIAIYPNPFNSFCTILLPTNNSNVGALLTLYNMQGNEIKTTIKTSSNTYVINRDGLQQGMYILSIQLNNQIIHKKLLIIN